MMTLPEELKYTTLSENNVPSAPNTGGQAMVTGAQSPFVPIPGGQATISGSQPPFMMIPPSQQTKTSRPLRHIPLVRKALKGLTVAQLVLGVLILVFGSSCLGLGLHMRNTRGTYYGPASCVLGTGTWVGVLSMATGSLGVAAVFLRSFPRGACRCLLISYFILCLISAIANALLLTVSVSWSIQTGNFVRYYSRHYDKSLAEGSLALNVFLVVMSFAALVLCVVSSSFICYLWSCCCDHKTAAHPQSSVSYIPPPAVQMQQTQPNQQYVLVPLSAVQHHQDGTITIC